MNTLFIVLTVILGAQASYHNEWDKPLSITCGSLKSVSSIHSIHSDKHEDRRWDIDCSNLPFSYYMYLYHLRASMETCAWTDFVNDFDKPLFHDCGSNGYITGMESYHDNKKEDRRWTFRCCSLEGYDTQDCESKWANVMDEEMNFEVPYPYVLTGVYSYHDNKKEDRRYKYTYCRLTK